MNFRWIAAGTMAAAYAASWPALAQQKLLAEKSELRFVAKQENVPMEGRFRKFAAEVNFDPQKPEASKATIDIDLNSIDMGSPDAESEIKGKPWFNVPVFPRATFALTSVKPLGGGKYEAQGKLSLKGIARDVAAPFQLRQQGGESIAEGAFAMKRLDFKIGEGEWSATDTVANDVQVRFRLVMTGVPAVSQR